MPQLQRYLILITCALLLLTSCKGDNQEKAHRSETLPTVKVKTAPTSSASAQGQVELLGTVEPVEKAIIAAKVTGTISKMPVKLGSTVQQGQLLVEISANEIAAKLRQAQAQLEQAKRNLDRETRLLAKNASTSQTVKAMEEGHRMAQASYREAKTMAGYTTITAPFAGHITAKPVNVGDLASPGAPLLVLENNRFLQVVTSVPEALVVNIHPGDKLMVRIPSASLTTTGTVAEVAPAADPASRTAPVKIDIDSSLKLRSGQFARISLTESSNQTIFVPASAVIPFGQMERVFVAVDGKAQLRLVRIGIQSDNMVEILSGLDTNEQVVIENNAHLVDGQPIEILP